MTFIAYLFGFIIAAYLVCQLNQSDRCSSCGWFLEEYDSNKDYCPNPDCDN